MDRTAEALDRALLFLTGSISDSGRERLKLLCRLAVAQLEDRLRAGMDPDELGEQFVSAAGVLALSMYSALGEEDFSAVKIGSLSFSRSGGRLSTQLRALAEELLAGCLEEQGFSFRRTRG